MTFWTQSSLCVAHNLKLKSLREGERRVGFNFSLSLFHRTLKNDPTLQSLALQYTWDPQLKDFLVEASDINIVHVQRSACQYWKTLCLPLVHIPYKLPLGKYYEEKKPQGFEKKHQLLIIRYFFLLFLFGF